MVPQKKQSLMDVLEQYRLYLDSAKGETEEARSQRLAPSGVRTPAPYSTRPSGMPREFEVTPADKYLNSYQRHLDAEASMLDEIFSQGLTPQGEADLYQDLQEMPERRSGHDAWYDFLKRREGTAPSPLKEPKSLNPGGPSSVPMPQRIAPPHPEPSVQTSAAAQALARLVPLATVGHPLGLVGNIAGHLAARSPAMQKNDSAISRFVNALFSP